MKKFKLNSYFFG